MNQKKALDILKSGRNVFLTGSAGAGKTYTIRQYIHHLKTHKVPVAVTASTGIAATHTQGITIHTWSGIGIKEYLSEQDLAKMKERKYLRDHIDNAKVLIIDEISMLHAKQLDLVNQVLKYFKENDLPFGGLQVIFSGDFFQLPPVGNPEETNRDKFAFMSKAWQEAKLTVCYLEEQFRQADHRLDGILNEIRRGEFSEQSRDLLLGTQTNTFSDELGAPKLYTHNANVDRINTEHLAQLAAVPYFFEAETKGNSKLVEMLKGSVRTDARLELKVGSKVMFIKNNFEKGYINGSLGEVIGFETTDEKGTLPRVRMRGGWEIVVERENWTIEDEMGKPIAEFKQIPLRLAWAITVHKSQGMTLDAAEIDLRHTFERGQGYVALSRLKHLDGLRLLGFNQTALELDPLAMRADKRFQELSAEAEKMDDEALRAEHDPFIVLSGGTLDVKEIKKQREKLAKKQPVAAVEKEAKLPKKQTYEITKELLDQGLSLEEAAEQRGMAISTIISHLPKIFECYPDTDFHRFKPDRSLLKKVEKAYRKVIRAQEEVVEKEKVSMKAIFEELGGEVSYNDIRLALFFVD